jgi:hypothetical protein
MSFAALQGSRMELGLRLNDWASPIQTSEKAIGHVIDFIVDDKSWAICHLVVETGHWYSGKEIVISPKPYRPDQLRGIQGIRERDRGSHSGSTAIPCFSARRGIWRYSEFRLMTGSVSLRYTATLAGRDEQFTTRLRVRPVKIVAASI